MTNGTFNDSSIVFLLIGGETLDSIPDWTFTYGIIWSTAIIKDLNNDGYDEVAVIVPQSMSSEKTLLFFGGETMPDEPDLTFNGAYDSPRKVRSIGDVNADGYNDMMTGGYGDDVQVYFGGNPMNTTPDISFYSPDIGGEVGFAGDVNGDGIHDFMFYGLYDYYSQKGEFFIYSDPSLTPHVEPWEENEQPSSFTLHQNFPNPFNGSTVIPFQCNKAGWVNLYIYNILGQKVYSLSHNGSAGELVRVLWDGTDMNGFLLPSGVYLVELSDGWVRETRKMQILR